MLSRIRRSARATILSVEQGRIALALTYAGDRLLSAALRRQPPPSRREPHHLVLLTNGAGNTGDQAMFEAFLANTTGAVTAIVRQRSDFVVPEDCVDRVRFLEAPRLVSRRGWGRKTEVARFLRAVDGSASFSVVGADIMDGGYSRAEAVKRAQLLRLATSRGVDSRVLGFSWNGRADVAARVALGRASARSKLFARDPISLQRLTKDGITALEAADVVFTTTGAQPPEGAIADWIEASTAPMVSVNVSGLIQRRANLVPEFAALIDSLVQQGYRVVLIPHVIRPGDDDLAACRAAHDRVIEKGSVLLVEEALRPAEVAWIASKSKAVLTGRMHLAILALNQGVVPVVLATQGKVEGLLHLFGLDDFALTPDPGVGVRALERLRMVIDSPDFSARVSERLPSVRELAFRSFN